MANERGNDGVDRGGEPITAAIGVAGHDLTEALARGLYDLDRHEWGGDPDWGSLRPHYVRKVERFLLPRLNGAT